MVDASLLPLLSRLGLDAVIPEAREVQRAYKKALRAGEGRDVEALREAAAVLSSAGTRSEYIQSHRLPSAGEPPLAIGAKPVARGVQHTGGEPTARSGCPGFGFASCQGKRPTMEDELIIGVPLGAKRYAFGVCDGHGGPRAARLLARHLPSALSKHLKYAAQRKGNEDGDDLPGAALEAFDEVDQHILESSVHERWDDGSTAIVAVVDVPHDGGPAAAVTLLQVGDGGACLWRGNASSSLAAAAAISESDPCDNPPSEHLCTRHRPCEPSEAVRLSSHGVEASATGRVAGLAVSRAFGDLSIKSLPNGSYLTVEPEVTSLSAHEISGGSGINGGSAVLVLACDGLWDYLSTDEVNSVLSSALDREGAEEGAPDLQGAALALVDEALLSGSGDNVSVLLVELRSSWSCTHVHVGVGS